MTDTSWTATGIGTIALLIWAIGAIVIVSIGKLPIFEIQIFVFLCSFSLSICRLSFFGTWHTVYPTPKIMWFVGVIGIGLASLCFIASLQFAPAEEVVLISCLWPILVLFLSPLFLKDSLKIQQILGAFIAFSGIIILLTNGKGLSGFEVCYWRGYILALLNTVFWTTYLLFSRKYSQVPKDMVGLYCGIAAICAIVFHLSFETFVLPSLKQLLLMLLLGFTGQGIAFLLWDHGIKHGHYKILCVLTYFMPIISTALLIFFNVANTSRYLWTVVLFVSVGAFLMAPQCIISLPVLRDRKRF